MIEIPTGVGALAAALFLGVGFTFGLMAGSRRELDILAEKLEVSQQAFVASKMLLAARDVAAEQGFLEEHHEGVEAAAEEAQGDMAAASKLAHAEAEGRMEAADPELLDARQRVENLKAEAEAKRAAEAEAGTE